MGSDRDHPVLLFLVTYVAPSAGLVPAVLSLFTINKDPTISQLTIIIITIFVYQIIFLIIMAINSWQTKKLITNLKLSEDNLSGYRESDKLFRQLADERSRFDKKVYNWLSSNDVDAESDLDEIIAEYSIFVCNKGVEIISKRKNIPDNQLSMNIKLFDKSPDGDEYFLIAGSTYYDSRRIEINAGRSFRYKVSENACYNEVMDNFSKKYFINNNMEKYIITDKSSDKFSEPNSDALRWYNKCIIVPIAEYTDNKNFNFISDQYKSTNRRAFGMLCLDSLSKNFSFDEENDANIVREIAINIYSVYHQKELLVNMKRKLGENES